MPLRASSNALEPEPEHLRAGNCVVLQRQELEGITAAMMKSSLF